MSLLGLEFSDAGMIVAAQHPAALLPLEGAYRESPGFALVQKKQMLVGAAAARQAYLQPRHVNHSFWDQLNSESLQHSVPRSQNHAELAYQHLASIWESVRDYGSELVLAVPGFFSREQMGLILGIAQALSMPLQGFVSLAVAAARETASESTLVHLDMHLHRAEITLLEQGERLAQIDSVTSVGNGLHTLQAEWAKAIAEEFVRTTRFDPLHHAAYEQELYDRLPGICLELCQSPSVVLAMTAGRQTYRVTLARELFIEKAATLYQAVYRLLVNTLEHHEHDGRTVTLQLTHRVSGLPGYRDMLARLSGARVIELKPGAGALGLLDLWDHLPVQTTGRSVSLFTSRTWPKTRGLEETYQPIDESTRTPLSPPTHVLYRSVAYPIGTGLLITEGEPGMGLWIGRQERRVGKSHILCSLQPRGADVVLTDLSIGSIEIDHIRASDAVTVQLGQVIRVRDTGDELYLITCLESNEA